MKPDLRHLPPHLREVCTILAAGLIRLRRRNEEEATQHSAGRQELGDGSLHFLADQSVCANRTNRRRT